MKKRIFLFVLFLMATLVNVYAAIDFVINGINYRIDNRYNGVRVISLPDGEKYTGSIVIPEYVFYDNKKYPVVVIGERAFCESSELSSVSIPNSVSTIESYAFYGCKILESITIPKSVHSISGDSFGGCDKLSSIIVEEGNEYYDSRNNCNAIIKTSRNALVVGCKTTIIPSDIKSIATSAFYERKGLSNISFPSTLVSIGLYSFAGCTDLKTVDLPNSVTEIGSYAFENCSSLESINLSNSLLSIPDRLFSSCNSLSSIKIPKRVSSIGILVFYGCGNLKKMEVEEGNEYYDSRETCNAIIRTNDNCLLFGCQSTRIPSSITSIDRYAFRNITGLESITIPMSVSLLGSSAFEGCRLKNILVKSINTAWEINPFSDATLRHATVFIPVNQFWDAVYDSDWSRFQNIREIATGTDEISQEKAYTLMNTDDYNFAVYDAVNNHVTNAESLYNIDENNPINGWQIVKDAGKTYLYNIGVRKYASISSDGKFSLSSLAIPIEMQESENGFKLGLSDKQWGFVINENLHPVEGLTAIETVCSDVTPNETYSIDGYKLQQTKKGVNLIRTNEGRVKKVIVK